MKIVFTPGYSISDYNIHDFYHAHKNDPVVELSNSLVFDRFRLGVAQGDIEPFNYEVLNENGDVIGTGDINRQGRFSRDSDIPTVLDQMSEILGGLLEIQWDTK